MFELCPYKYFGRYVAGFPEPPNLSLELGKTVHAAIELIHEGMDIEEAINEALELSALPLDRSEVRSLVSRARISPRVGFVETDFLIEVVRHPKVLLYGRVDWVVFIGDTAYVTDWKTNRVPEYATKSRQLDVYAAGLMLARTDVERVKAKYFFLRTGETHEKEYRAVPREALDWVRETALDILQRGDDVENFPPRPGPHCRYCPFVRQCYEKWEIQL